MASHSLASKLIQDPEVQVVVSPSGEPSYLQIPWKVVESLTNGEWETLDPHIPIHNNQAERDLRHAVILRRLSGGTKSEAGDRSLERHLSVIQTAKKQDLNVFQTLHGLLTNQLHPSILTAKTLSFN